MVSISQVEKGIARYLDAELVDLLPDNGVQRLIAATGISLMIKRSGQMFENIKNNDWVRMLGIIDDDQIDIDTLRDELKANMPDSGVKVDIPVLGKITLKKDDVDKLHDYIAG